MNYRIVVIGILWLCGMASALGKAHHNPVHITFCDSTYIVEYSFAATLSDSILLDIFHKPDHMNHYLSQINLSLKPLLEEKDFNRIEYTYFYIVSRLMLTFERQIKRTERTVSFYTSKTDRSNAIVPRVHTTEGYYKIVDDTTGKRVVYYQKTVLDRKFNKLYTFVITRATNTFLKDLIEYIDKVQKRLK